jgi:hypothetical protein
VWTAFSRFSNEQRKDFEFMREKYGRVAINATDDIPQRSIVGSRPLDVARSFSSHDYLLRAAVPYDAE